MIKTISSVSRAACMALLAGGFCLSAAALPTTQPGQSVDLAASPGGIGTFVIYGGYTVNRQFNGYAELYQNGKVIRQLPASNIENVVTGHADGFTWIDANNDNLNLYFYRQGTNPTSTDGQYEVVVPAGYLYTNAECTETNPEWKFPINVYGGSSSSFFEVNPPADQTYESLQTITVTLPDPKYDFGDPLPQVQINEITGEGRTFTPTMTREGNTVTLTLDEPITTTGKYHVFYPQGFLMVNTGTAESPKWEAVDTLSGDNTGGGRTQSYYIESVPKNLTILPNPEETLPFIQGEAKTVMVTGREVQRYALFTVTLEEDIRLLLNQAPKFYALDEEGQITGEPLAIFGTAYLPSESKRTFYVVSNTDVSEDPDGGNLLVAPGEYALVFPRQSYYTTSGYNGEFQIRYTIGVNDQFPVIIRPTDGTISKSLQYFTVTFDEGNTIELTSKSYAHLSNGIAEYALQGTLTDGLTNEVTFALPTPMEYEGTWTFSTPSSMTVNGINTGVTAKYTVDPNFADVDKTMNITPAPGEVEKLDKFNITFAAAPDANIGQEGGSITLVKKGESEDTNIEIPVKYYDFDSKSFLIDLEKTIEEEGVYVLTIAANTFWVGEENGFANEAATFTYNLKRQSVDGIFVDDAPAALYNAAGILIMDNAVKSDLQNLDKGLYIYKGQKFIVK